MSHWNASTSGTIFFTCSSFSFDRPQIITLFSGLRRFARARPIPELPPVIRIVWFCSFIISFFFQRERDAPAIPLTYVNSWLAPDPAQGNGRNAQVRCYHGLFETLLEMMILLEKRLISL